jgi:tripartite-type tricarboxylate transporter receptor subunit TctC
VEKRLAEGGNVASPSTPEEMRQKIEGDIARWSRVIDMAGIKTE